MHLTIRVALTFAAGLAFATPNAAQAQTQIRTQAKAQAEAIADIRDRGIQASPRYWDSYWNWYDSSYRPYYHGRSRTRDNDTQPRDRGYFGERYGGEEIDDYQDWREDYYRNRVLRDGRSLDRDQGSRSLNDDRRRSDRYDDYRTPQYDVWSQSGGNRTGRSGGARPGTYYGYGAGWH